MGMSEGVEEELEGCTLELVDSEVEDGDLRPGPRQLKGFGYNSDRSASEDKTYRAGYYYFYVQHLHFSRQQSIFTTWC